ncbi:MAG: hypothetical protein GW760_03820 [Legionella sp.]|nr:hypothetical protein [Legionella sp.]
MKDIKVLGIDLAKNVFQIHGADSNGKCKLRKRVDRQELIEFMGNDGSSICEAVRDVQ